MSDILYQSLKSDAINMHSGLSEEDVKNLIERVDNVHEDGQITNSQYDDIMRLIQNIQE